VSTYIEIFSFGIGILVLTIEVLLTQDLDIVGWEPTLATLAVASPPPRFQLGENLNHIILFETQVGGILRVVVVQGPHQDLDVESLRDHVLRRVVVVAVGLVDGERGERGGLR
jgi:hypothetical protein